MKTCPVCNKPIDIFTFARDAHQVRSDGGKWMGTKLFSTADEAFEWRAAFDLAESVKTAKVSGGDDGFRMVGDGWITTLFNTRSGLDAWVASIEPEQKKQRGRKNAAVSDAG